MKPPKISHVSLALVTTITILSGLLGIYMFHELNVVTSAVQQREQNAATEEIEEALASLDQSIRKIAQDLADWDETHQQLVFDTYYAIWRDSRVKDAGIVPKTIDIVALYNKSGTILHPSPSGTPMPDHLTEDKLSRFLVKSRNISIQKHAHIDFFMPAFADPDKKILMGYVGLKIDLLGELKKLRQYRFANLDTLQLAVPQSSVPHLTELIGNISFEVRPNHSTLFIREELKNELANMLIFVTGILSLAFFLLHRIMVKPLQAISQEIDALHDTSGDIANKTSTENSMPVAELEHVRRSFNNYRNHLSELHKNLKQNSIDFYEQARHDSLTGTLNRRALEENWGTTLSKISDIGFSFMLFDCDHFKSINDTYGHSVGDSVIKAIANCIEKSLRTGDQLYRLGGDEFATLLPGTSRATAKVIAERCITQIQRHNFPQYGIPEPVGISIGITVSDISKDIPSLSEIIKQADLAMYTAKNPNNDKIVFFHESLGETASIVANTAINAVYNAIKHPELFSMRYQSIMLLPECSEDYVEALTKISIEGDIFLPGDIFPIIHSRRLEAEFDLAIIKAIQLDIDKGNLDHHQGISINISAPGIVNSKVISTLLDMKKHQPRRKIVIEITETALITQMEVATNHINQLRNAEFLVALDDFGSGYSSLRYLASMPVDIVKFDISMIRLLEQQNNEQYYITEEMAKIVKKAGYLSVAEGIESKTMLNRVIELGFDYAQGYLFGKP